jgi:hypothetical protein
MTTSWDSKNTNQTAKLPPDLSHALSTCGAHFKNTSITTVLPQLPQLLLAPLLPAVLLLPLLAPLLQQCCCCCCCRRCW